MKKKLTGLTASGQIHPEIRPGDIFKYKRGKFVTIKTVTHNLSTVEDVDHD